MTFTDAADKVTFDIAVDGGTAKTVTIDQTALASVGNNDSTLDDVNELNAIFTAQGVTGVTASVSGSKLVLTSSTTGTSSTVAVTNFAETDADNDTTITGIGVRFGTGR